jgi:hypothetical protein
MPVILATQEAAISRIEVQSQPEQIVALDPISKTSSQKKRAGGVAQNVGPELKPKKFERKKKERKRCGGSHL